jgi:hypothetical protein
MLAGVSGGKNQAVQQDRVEDGGILRVRPTSRPPTGQPLKPHAVLLDSVRLVRIDDFQLAAIAQTDFQITQRKAVHHLCEAAGSAKLPGSRLNYDKLRKFVI